VSAAFLLAASLALQEPPRPPAAAAREAVVITHETPLVREDRLDDPHWSAIYQGARRPR